MTDFDKVSQVFTDLGIDFTVQTSRGNPCTTLIALYADSSAKVQGYSGFFTYFAFDTKTGVFEQVGIYE